MSCSCCCHTPVIEVENLTFSYRKGDTPTLENVNFTVGFGESGCIVGPNGGGKSTLLKLMLGILTPDSGTIKIFGKTPAESARRIGYMPQYHQLDAAFPATVLEVALMGRARRNLFGCYSKEDRKEARAALEEMGCGGLEKRSFSTLSGGQRQRVLIARALASAPELLLLDEPTANIDPGAEEQFYSTLEILKGRMTVLTVSHDLGFVSRETDHIICVNRKVSVHTSGDFTSETADEIYHHKVNLIQHEHSCFCHCANHAEEGK